MQIPDAFYDYCTWLHQDSEFDYGPATEDIIAGALKRIRPEQHQLLRAFIEELLTGPYSESDLMKIFRSTKADITPRGPDGARQFLVYLRDLIDEG